MKIDNKTPWVISLNVRCTSTEDGLLLLDYDRDMYCDMNLLAGWVWLLIKWTPAGITVKEIADLLEQVVVLPRRSLEVHTCRCVAKLLRAGFVHSRSRSDPIDEDRNYDKQLDDGGIPWLQTQLTN